jgi:hypothetical protein
MRLLIASIDIVLTTGVRRLKEKTGIRFAHSSSAAKRMSLQSASCTRLQPEEPAHALFKQIQANPDLSFLVKTMQQAGYETRIAGGAVRDLISGRLPDDIDLATVATPQQTIAALE